ncbi:MAG: DUF3786 domain-containing protein [Bacillota bacterium]|nr:DUF3786 domain-containing protein [Bacillota bacterium]
MDKNNSKFNLEYTLELAQKDLLEKKIPLICKNTGVTFSQQEQCFKLPYLNHKVRIYLSGEINSDKELNIHEKITILHYLNNGGAGKAINSDNLISFKELPGGAIYIVPFTNRAIKPLIKMFGNSPEKLITVAQKWEGGQATFGDYSIFIPVFPKVTITYVIWAGDEEFPPNATILFNQSIVNYLPTEDVAVIASQLVYQMPGLLG